MKKSKLATLQKNRTFLCGSGYKITMLLWKRGIVMV